MEYSASKAALYNQLIQEGRSQDEAIAQAGITDAESVNYAIGDNGQLGPLVIGVGKVAGVDYEKFTPDELAESERWTKSLESSSEGIQSYPFNQTATAGPTTMTVTTSVQETTTGGGVVTIKGPDLSLSQAQSDAVKQLDLRASAYEANATSRFGPGTIDKAEAAGAITKEEAAQLRSGTLSTDQRFEVATQARQEANALPLDGKPEITRPSNTNFDPNATLAANPPGAGLQQSGTSPTAAEEQVPEALAIADREDREAAGVTPLSETAIAAQPVTEVVTEGSDFLSASDIRDANETTVFAGDPYADNQDNEQFLSASDVVGNDETDNGISPYGEENELRDYSESDIATNSQTTLLPGGDPYADRQDDETAEERISAYGSEDFVPTDDPYSRSQGTEDFIPGVTDATPDQIADLEDAEAGARAAAFLDQARAQNTIANQRKGVNNADWRVRLRLAPLADYLYMSQEPGILEPLRATDGVLFPYTPTIQTTYKANYSTADITHSNYRGYFYQGSVVEPVTISCPFTAQGTAEADYLLAVIHFFKSVTKMFYGQDPQRGSPPPVVYLSGLGQFQYNEHPCVVTSFTYDLPADVDYIRARSPNVNNSNMLPQRQATNSQVGLLGKVLSPQVARLLNSPVINPAVGAVIGNLFSLPKGGEMPKPAPQTLGASTQPTYVPTKMTMSITLLPIISRQRQSQDFSLRQYANGDLLKGGMW